DASGGISYEELAARLPRVTQERFNTLDRDGDGQLSQGELSAARPRPHADGPRPNADGEFPRPRLEPRPRPRLEPRPRPNAGG
ncbi:MAG: hypothetical protein NZM12_05445, partial [Steroidobacteraceae bacterium]|nr:hypothetical protein [Steroidobacteraceae bacterium]MDW8258889.1 hypothetical protein [Gammaproteobacteria bacterium]